MERTFDLITQPTEEKTMTLKEAIKDARIIKAPVHISEGWSHQIKISKKDALLACEDHLDSMVIDPSIEGGHFENDHGSIIASILNREMSVKHGKLWRIGTLSIGR